MKTELAQFAAGKLQKGFILGMPGTGKSYTLFNTVLPAWQAKNPKGRIGILAFTNMACNVLREYAAQFGYVESEVFTISTIHRFCKLTPGLNMSATRHKDLHQTHRRGEADEVDLLVIDEVGMVNEELEEALEECYLADKFKQVMYLGDYEQLLPVNGTQAIKPKSGDWVQRLTEIKRSDAADIADVIVRLNQRIQGKTSGSRIRLKATSNIVPGEPSDGDVVAAWRNATVQQHNAEIQGYKYPRPGDRVYCDTLKTELVVEEVITRLEFEDFDFLKIRAGSDGSPQFLDDDSDDFRTRYRIGNVMHKQINGHLCGLSVLDPDGNKVNIITLFGTGDYRAAGRELLEACLEANDDCMQALGLEYLPDDRQRKEKRVQDKTGKVFKSLAKYIDLKFKGLTRAAKPREVVERGDAWSAYISYKDFIFHADFTHARTVHSLQGSSVDTVFVDVSDLAGAPDSDYHRLLYVAASRARKKVFYG